MFEYLIFVYCWVHNLTHMSNEKWCVTMASFWKWCFWDEYIFPWIWIQESVIDILYLCPCKNISAWISPFWKWSQHLASFYITSPLYPKWSSSIITHFCLLYYEVSNLVMVFPSCEGLVGPPLIVHSGRPLWPTWRPLLGGANGIAGGRRGKKNRADLAKNL